MAEGVPNIQGVRRGGGRKSGGVFDDDIYVIFHTFLKLHLHLSPRIDTQCYFSPCCICKHSMNLFPVLYSDDILGNRMGEKRCGNVQEQKKY